MEDATFDQLLGEHVLTGVDRLSKSMESWSGFEDCEVLNFTLDGKTYTACEDPEDGYRSAMRYLRVSDEPTTNTFPPVRVVGRMKERTEYEEHCVLQLIDAVTGGLVLEVGTGNTDDYYPYWVAYFNPENMSVNQQ